MSAIIAKIPFTVRAAFARAAWTFLVTILPALGVGAATELDYVTAANIALGAAILSFVKSLAVGMPEATPVLVEPFVAPVTVSAVEPATMLDGAKAVRVVLSDGSEGHYLA